ncbi:MAG: nucleoside-triphosphatase [Eubacteriales bacterium]|nr:nucleoside-triphosphatase [Eubacteriales bacterium]
MKRNILITGARGAGKSTLADWLIGRLGRPCAGYRTVRDEITPAGPLYRMTDLLTGESAPISRLAGGGIRGVPETFDGFGAACVRAALGSDAPVLLFDEIGRFEQSSPAFLEAVTAALDSEKTVIAVLKKEEMPHIARFRARRDGLLLDLDEIPRAAAREKLREFLDGT